MFERYTENARRAIFFARYEASSFGTGAIEPEHLLLGMLREGSRLMSDLLGSEIHWDQLRQKLETRLGQAHPAISTSVDMPLTESSKRILGFAEEEADAGGSIEPQHLLLGVLREEGSYAAELLRELGGDAGAVRSKLSSGA